MKQVKFNLDNLFRLSSISAIQTFEFENNSAEILISTDVKDELAYELHIENSEGKSFVILDKGEKHISCILTSGMLKVGVNKIQLRGIGENDYIIESNSAEFIVRSFINANVEPTPEEQTAFERLVVKVNIIENDVEGLKGDVDGINRELENKANKSDIPTKTSVLENDSDFITSKDIPTVPTKTSQLTNDSGFITSRDIPTIPTKTSQLENDSDFVTSAAIPTKTSQLENDSGYVTESAIPTKVSQLENDSEFVTKQQLDSKMEFYKLDYVGGSLSHEGVVLNYAQIIEKFNDNKYFLYAEGDGFVYIPTLPPLPGDEIIEFSSSYIYGGKNYMSRIIINSENQVKWEEIEVVRATDFKDLQSEVQTIEDNKVSAITEENKSSTENYPSNKAMTDYVKEHGGSGAVSDVQIEGTSILVNGVANIPVAGDNFGVVKLLDNGVYGVKLSSKANPYLIITTSVLNEYKAGGYTYKAVTIANQHASTFYGLAKASGTDEKNSTLPLGQYTEGAQASIQRMIGLGDIKESVEDLWLLNKDISYKVTNQLESGMNVAPKGMFAESLLDVRGKSEQKSTNGYNLSDFQYNAYWSTSNPCVIARADGDLKRLALTTPIPNPTGKTFTISVRNKTQSHWSVVARLCDGNMNIIKSLVDISAEDRPTFTISDNCEYMCLAFVLDNFSVVDESSIDNIMLEVGTVAHDYEPYTGGVSSPNPDYPQPISSVEEIHFDVNGVKKTIIPPFPLNKIGDYYDSAEVDKGVWSNKIASDVFKNSDNWQMAGDGNFFLNSPSVMIVDRGAMCSIFRPVAYYTLRDKSQTGISTQLSGEHRLWISSVYASSVEELKALIDNVPYIYIVNTPTETPISATDLDYLKSLQKLKDNSVITITDQNGNDVSFLMEYIIKLSEVN